MCVCLSACSLLSKEQGVTVLGACAGYDVFLNWEPLWRAIFETTCKAKRKRKNSDEVVMVADTAHLLENIENTEKSQPIGNGEPAIKISSPISNKKGKNKTSISESKDSPQIGMIVGRIGMFFYDIFHYCMSFDQCVFHCSCTGNSRNATHVVQTFHEL